MTDARITGALLTTTGTPEGRCGRRKMTADLRRSGIDVAGCTVDRLMRDESPSGIVRGRKHHTTIADRNASRAPDLLERYFIVTSQAGSGSPTSSTCRQVGVCLCGLE
ncbi:IS3 family transposase [Mycobacterium sp. PDNC021]|uniref:IS3 family transposase n=1 Tax=Mycobacterium sp. PDNC021 TaxID=3391399 RepID=UPI003AAC6407